MAATAGEDRAGRSPLRGRAAAALRRHRADRGPPHRRAGRARPRGDAVRECRRPHQSEAGAGSRPGHPARPEPAEVRPRRPPLDAARAAPAGARVRRPPLPRRPRPLPVLRGARGADRDHAARPARPEGPRRGLPALAGLPAGLHLAPPEAAAPLGQLGRHGRARRARGPLPLHRGARGRLPRLPRPHLAREAARPGDRDRQARGAQAQDRGQGRRGRPGLLRAGDRAVARRSRWSSSSARSATPRSPRSSATPGRSCSRSTGPSRSASP